MPINGHQRHSEHLAELGLSEWQRTSVGFHEPGEFGSIELLAKEVRDPRRTVSAAVVSDALAEDRRVYQRFSPNGQSYCGALPKCFHKLLVGNGANQGASQGADRMIHVLQKKPLGIRPVAWVMKAEVLPGTRPQSVVPDHDALDNNRCGLRFIALPEEIFAGCEFPDFVTQAADRSDVRTVNGRVVFEFSQKDVAWRHFSNVLTQLTIINVASDFGSLSNDKTQEQKLVIKGGAVAKACVMPIRPFLASEPFDPEIIAMMSAALESVCKALGLNIVDDPATRACCAEDH